MTILVLLFYKKTYCLPNNNPDKCLSIHGLKLFLLLLHKSLWNSFKDLSSYAQPNDSALESECKSRTKYHYHQTHTQTFLRKNKNNFRDGKIWYVEMAESIEIWMEAIPTLLVFYLTFFFSGNTQNVHHTNLYLAKRYNKKVSSSTSQAY